jgi:para-nitrobenzyl esterase
MKKIYSSLVAITTVATSFAQYGTGRYETKSFAYDSAINVVYGSAKLYTGITTSLKMDVLQPKNDSLAARPLVIWVHGGSFIGGDKSNDVAITRDLTQRGYVTANINYRLGVFPLDSINAFKAATRAMQDLKAAIRFFYKDASTTNTYKIDTNNIYIGGSSAGAITAMHAAYLSKACVIEPFIGGAAVLTGLGGLDGVSGNPGYSTKVKGVINLCGALVRYGLIDSTSVPLCSMHGTVDGTVKYGRGYVTPAGVKLLLLDGSRMIKQQSEIVNHKHDFYTWYGADHVPYQGGGAYLDSTMTFISGFLLNQVKGTSVNLIPAPNTYFGSQALYPTTTTCLTATVNAIEGITASELNIYPNPAVTSLVVSSETSINEVVVLDITGAIVKSIKVNANKVTINRDNLASGTYILKVIMANEVVTKKISFN